MTHAFHHRRRRAVAVACARRHETHTLCLLALMLFTIVVLLSLAGVARADTLAHEDGALPLEQLAHDPAFAFLDQPLPVSHTLSGNYLAGRFAQRRQDWSAAHTYIGEVALRDNANPAMTQRAFLLAVGAGQFAQAQRLADSINTQDPAADVAHIFLAAAALQQGQGERALAHLARLPDSGFGDFTKPLLTAWALAAKGDFDAALAVFDATDPTGAEATFAFHRGMIAALAGRDKTAVDAYMVSMREGLSLHSALVISAYFDRKNAPQVSAKIYEGIDKLFDVAPTLGVTPRAQKDTATPAVAEGAALAVFDIASMLYERRAHDSAQVYANIAHMLSPDMAFPRLMLGDIAALAGQYDVALGHYAAIGDASPLYWLSRLRVAEVHEANGQLGHAAHVLGTLAQEPRTRLPSLVALGDIYRRQDDLTNARKAYDAAVAVVPDKPEVKAPLLYSRAMTADRLGDWGAARGDLLAAIRLQPDNAQVLNFTGYRMIEQGEDTDQAFTYIRRAMALKPDDGYILDSYGWALHRRGDTQGAIPWLEKAVAAIPGNAAILDHLGDVYWFAGRVTEAQFQWQRARDLTDDHAFRTGVEAKLRHGLSLAPAPQVVEKRDARI